MNSIWEWLQVKEEQLAWTMLELRGDYRVGEDLAAKEVALRVLYPLLA
jgi:hypothetical protein